MVEQLIANGADLNTRTASNNTALIAAFKESKRIIPYLALCFTHRI